MTREKMRRKEGRNRATTQDAASCPPLPPPRRPRKSRRSERRGSQYGGWRGRARDKMATSEKLVEENHGDRSRRRARALVFSRRPNSPRSCVASGQEHWNRKRPLIHAGNSHIISITSNDDDDDDKLYEYHEDATFSISPKHSPSRGTARRAISPAYLAQSFRNAYRMKKRKRTTRD